jgi:hypothetical protein
VSIVLICSLFFIFALVIRFLCLLFIIELVLCSWRCLLVVFSILYDCSWVFFVLWFCFLNLFCLVLDRVMVSSSCFCSCPCSLFLNLLFVLDVVRCYDVFFVFCACYVCLVFVFILGRVLCSCCCLAYCPCVCLRLFLLSILFVAMCSQSLFFVLCSWPWSLFFLKFHVLSFLFTVLQVCLCCLWVFVLAGALITRFDGNESVCGPSNESGQQQ